MFIIAFQLLRCRGSLACAQCKKAHYCCRTHQKEHWKRHKLECGKDATNVPTAGELAAAEEQVAARALFPEYSLVVEEEVFEGEDEAELAKIMRDANIWEDAVTEGGAEEEADAKLTQADYQRAMGSELHDPTYLNFLTRVERGGRDQVLRYCRASAAVGEDGTNAGSQAGSRSTKGLLLLSSDKELLQRRAATIQTSPCPRCGAPRTFECQVGQQGEFCGSHNHSLGCCMV